MFSYTKGLLQRSWNYNKKDFSAITLQKHPSKQLYMFSQTASKVVLQLFNKMKNEEWPHWEFYTKLSFMSCLGFFLQGNIGMETDMRWHLVSGINGSMHN